MRYELKGKYPLSREEFDRRIGEAERCLFVLGVGDAAEAVGRINATLFLAKMHFIQERLGYEHHAMIIGAPDFTFQTTPHKFHEAVPEGGKVIWGDGAYDFVPGEMEPDFCGLLVGAVENDFSLEEVLDNLHGIKEEDNLYVDSVKIKLNNFSMGSHFLNVYEVEDYEELGLSKMVAVLHTSSDEMRNPLIDFVRERSEEMKTPFGVSHVLLGDDAREYEKKCVEASRFAKSKRKLLFEKILGGGKIIAIHNHNELCGLNEAIIGCCNIRQEGEVFIITKDEGLPAHLVKGKMNLSRKKIEELGFDSERPPEWIRERLLNANILPHGCGHKLIEVEGVEKVILYPDVKVILPRYKPGKSDTTAYTDMWTIHRRYRSDEVLKKVRSLELADDYGTLRFIDGIKVDF